MHSILRLGGAKKKVENQTIQDAGPSVIVNRTLHSADIKNNTFSLLYCTVFWQLGNAKRP
jgi:hypothetical protein